MQKIYPLRMSCACLHRIWGGSRLCEDYGLVSSSEKNIGEAWVLSAYDEAVMSRIKNGELEGMSVKEYFASEKEIPLIKLIDAADKLSLQVHPDDEYAKKHENGSGKSELWYIVDAAPDSEIIYGLSDGATTDDLMNAIKENNIGAVANVVKVKKGDSFYIPAGLVHAIGGGILIAEIQQNSDLTYRVYDYDRTDTDGKKRELHVEKAIDVIKPYTKSEIEKAQYSQGCPDGERIACTEYFSVRHIVGGEERDMCVHGELFDCLLLISGDAYVIANEIKYSLKKGECMLLPSGLGTYRLCGKDKDVLLTSA